MKDSVRLRRQDMKKHFEKKEGKMSVAEFKKALTESNVILANSDFERYESFLVSSIRLPIYLSIFISSKMKR